MSRRYGLRDDQWAKIEQMLPGRKGSVGVTAKDNRLFIEAVLYRYRSGIPWRDLPERYGDFRVVHKRFSLWSKKGVWERIFKVLSEEGDNEYMMIDSMIVRAHQHSSGAKASSAESEAIDELGRYEEAIASYDKAVAINPNDDLAWCSRGYALWKYGKLSDAANSFAKAIEIAPNDLSALSSDIALSLVQYDIPHMQQRLAVALPLLKPNLADFAVLPFLQWLAAPQTSPQFILDAIRQLEPTVKITWDFSDMQPALDRLTPAQQTIAYAFIDFFKNNYDFVTLQQGINQFKL